MFKFEVLPVQSEKMSQLFIIFGLCFITGLSADHGVPEELPEKDYLIPDSPQPKSLAPEVCHSVGCFNLREPWISKSRPLDIPESPERISTKFYLYNRRYKMNPVVFPFQNDIDLSHSKFDSDKKTLIIVESFYIEQIANWTKILKDVYLDKVDANVIVVNWKNGSMDVSYLQAASNARVVGKQLALIIKKLVKVFGANLDDFHMVCHGLGAHICGYAGKEARGIGRLTALDPAQPYFEGFPTEVRLYKSDAKLVDVIHSDAKPYKPDFGFGMIKPVGDVDFYMNGGFDQPGCHSPKTIAYYRLIIENLRRYPISPVLGSILHCDHLRAPYYFIEAVRERNDCVMFGHLSDSRHSFDTSDEFREKVKPHSNDCTDTDCLKMGLDTEKSTLKGIFVVPTKSHPPYCVADYWKGKENHSIWPSIFSWI